MEHGTQQSLETGRWVRRAALGGVVGPALFVVVVIAGGLLYDDYSHTVQKISELGGVEAELAFIQIVNFIVFGLLVLGFAWSLGRTLGRPYLGQILIGFFAVSSGILNGVLPCDPGCLGLTPIAQGHNVAGFIGFLAAIAGMVMLARRWQHDRRWQHLVPFTALCVAISSAGLGWFVTTQVLDRQALAGIAQRTFVLTLLVWIAVTAWTLHRQLVEQDRMLADDPAVTGSRG